MTKQLICTVKQIKMCPKNITCRPAGGVDPPLDLFVNSGVHLNICICHCDL